MSGICFFNTTKAWGGGEKWHLEAATYLWKQQQTVLLVAHSKGALYQKAQAIGIPVHGLESGNLSFLNILKVYRLRQFFKRNAFGVVLMNLSRDVKLAGLAARWAGIPRIIYRRGSDIPVRNTWLNRLLFGKVISEVLVNSNATATSLLSNNPTLFPKEKIKVAYNGLDFEGMAQKLQTKAKQSVPGYDFGTGNPVHLVNLGRLEAQKNQGFLIDVAVELSRRALDFRMHIGGEGRLRKVLEDRINQENLEDRVKLHGFIDSPLDFLSGGDIFLLPSHWEGFGYVLAEAAYVRKPVVAFNSSSNPEVIPDGKAGILTAPGDCMAFCDAVQSLIESPERRATMGDYGHGYVTQNFEREKIMADIAAYLSSED
ncbi:Glycosyltransferase involved in cell wall bisynthesis [Robiginitalea myxolifaciens]|uniref:Glycosyltransferase involved in cell wall bisynthesis n=1 Tax=Robiginitalea myxolifaciens TaxID=400055 RepID=A0A1I6H8D3_9FLAO|nr:glycosyltransferase [Robiginitalea myxolifaciens]SFR50611.1 Glycosyltransferase involved in cell wall bisynthesis [Robiginitalea myxolifaciens]